MNKFHFLFLFLSFIVIFSSCKQDAITLIQKGKTQHKIFIPKNADSTDRNAAQVLQNHLQQITQVLMPIQGSPDIEPHSLMISLTPISTDSISDYNTLLSEDGFLITHTGQSLILKGGNKKGLLYAVYTLLEHWGCRYYSPEMKSIPNLKTLYLPEINTIENPIIKHRETNFVNHFTPEFMDWHKLDDHRQEWGMWVHTFDRLISSDSYFNAHPEYFSLVNGKRIPNGQLCLSNPEVLNTLVENLRPEIIAHPEYSHWSVSQNDHYNACECDNCKKEYETYGGYSGALIHFINQVAAEFPDKIISTLAYQYTRQAPTHIKPAHNVNIVLCTIEFNRSMPLPDDPRSEAFTKDLDDWAAITDDILIWDYTVQYRNLVSPFPNHKVLQANIQFFTEHGAYKMFQQASGSLWSDFRELKQYTLAKLLWNPDVNIDSIKNEFINAYYGDAAPFLSQYLNDLHQELDKVKQDHFLSIYGYPHDAVGNFLRPEMLKQYSHLFDLAENAVAKDSLLLHRVRKTRLPLEFAILDISLHNINDTLSFVSTKEGKRHINQQMKQRLEQFTNRALAYGISRLEEHGLPPQQYHDMLIDFIDKSLISNLAINKDIEALIPCSKRYEPKGILALTDGTFGLKDYNFNFLGWEGKPMEVIIDLEEITQIHSISADFLQDQLAWIFLPKSVEVWTSINKTDWNYSGFDTHNIPSKQKGRFTKSFRVEMDPVKTRFVKIKANALINCPEWHVGANLSSWIFTDEIVIQ
ncbi:MAG: DUF4838 domain-containing protein [Bacteroidales bacterium]|nr:DUF4838 domain-containing protein [Bacteroidales bacterium]